MNMEFQGLHWATLQKKERNPWTCFCLEEELRKLISKGGISNTSRSLNPDDDDEELPPGNTLFLNNEKHHMQLKSELQMKKQYTKKEKGKITWKNSEARSENPLKKSPSDRRVEWRKW